MPTTVLFDNGSHRNVLFDDFGLGGLAVQANQHLIIDGAASGEAVILDPGGHKVYAEALAETFSQLGPAALRYIFLSHQDPDIVAALNGWLMTTDAQAFVSSLWTRFIPHFGFDHLVGDRLHPIPDEGMVLPLGASPLVIVPAHFLHSEGNHQLYDPVARILYTGDLGASIGAPYVKVEDFDAHLPYLEGFHRRYMASRRVMVAWATMVSSLDIDIIAPQHGAYFEGRELVQRFIAWCAGLDCGVDLITPLYRVPGGW